MDGVLNWLQNILAFSVLSLVTPLTYAVASASKRIFVIAISLFILGNPVTWVNVLGMVMACCGVLCYNRVSWELFDNVNKGLMSFLSGEVLRSGPESLVAIIYKLKISKVPTASERLHANKRET